jgi:hypothetical protein
MDEEALIAVLTPVVLEESEDRPARRKRRPRRQAEPVVLWEWKAEPPAESARVSNDEAAADKEPPRG